MPKIIICKEKKAFVPELNREVTTVKARKFFVEDVEKPFHTEYGSISSSELQKQDGSRITTSMNKEFTVFSAKFIDVYKRLKKLPQTIPLKDIGTIIAETGINQDSVIVDAGTGSAALACFLAHLCKKVVSYEIREDFLQNIQRNIDELGLKNVEVKNKDVCAGIDEDSVDLVTFDLPEPWKAITSAEKALKIGGFLVSYSPSVPQVMDFVNKIGENENFLVVKTVEMVERLWDVSGRKVRPKSTPIGHSGFMTFVRKIS